MRMIPYSLVGCLALASTGAAAAATPRDGGAQRALVIALDVAEDRAPEWVCVVTHHACRALPADRANGSRGDACDSLELDGLRPHLTPGAGQRYRFTESSWSGRVPRDLRSALAALVRPEPAARVCSHEDNGLCTPELDLRGFITTRGTLSGEIACGAKPGARALQYGAGLSAGGFQDRRVAFLSLSFSDAALRVPGVEDVSLVGTTATVHFEAAPAPSNTTMIQVIGGDYVPSASSAFGSIASVIVKLQPRCRLTVVDVPDARSPITSVSLDSASLGQSSCQPDSPASRSLPLEIPFVPTNEWKRLTVTQGTEHTTISELRWTTALPASHGQVGLRSFAFYWQRPPDCFAERWGEPTPPRERGSWSRSCPRVTLPEHSTICSLTSSDELGAAPPERCAYRCEIGPQLEAAAFPIKVQFDRMRGAVTGDGSDTLYSWADQLAYPEQVLTSVVAEPNRRVMIEFPDPAAWQDRYGDKIDAIRYRIGQSTGEMFLKGRTTPEMPARWVSLPSPGRSCSDVVRVMISGTRRYEDATLVVKQGRVELTRPDDYRVPLRFYALLGVGTTFRYLRDNVRSATLGDAGVGAQWDLGRSMSMNLEIAGQLTHTFYGGIELSSDRRAEYFSVAYLRFDIRTALEWWFLRRFGAAVGAGGGFGTPLSFADSHIVGDVQFSAVIELQPLVFTVLPRRLWLVSGGGLRLAEQHRNYGSDFAGSPIPEFERDPQGYVFLRLRGALE